MVLSCKYEQNSLDTNEVNNFIEYKAGQSVDDFVSQLKDHYKLPGVATAFIENDSITHIIVKGENKSFNGSTLSIDSKFQIGSCGKAFTALLITTFIEEGIISWNTKLSDVYHDINIHKGYKKVTLKQLLSHTSGLREYSSDEEVFNIKGLIPHLEGDIIEKREIFTKWNLEQKPVFTVGEYHYSNAGYIIIASMLEKLSGRSYESLMKERVFKPLDLHTAEFGYPFFNDHSQPHRHMFRDENDRGITLKDNERIPDQIFHPAGFISLSIEDFATFVLVSVKALQGKETPFDNKLILELFKPAIKLENGYEIALGWQIITVNGTQTYGHTGSDQTIRAAMSINPKTNQAVVFATNIGDPTSEIALVNLITELLDL